MKKILTAALISLMFIFVLCGCGGNPLAKAYDSLSDIAQSQGSDATYVEQPLVVEYDEEGDVLKIRMSSGADLEAIFGAINKAVEGEDIGTIYFSLTGTRGDGFEDDVAQKIGELSCASMQKLGIDYYIAQAGKHNWLDLSEKASTLYFASNLNVFGEYSEDELKQLANFKDVQVVYYESGVFSGIDRFAGAETLALVPEVTINVSDSSNDPMENVLEGNEYLNSDSASSDTEANTEESSESEEAVSALPLEYYASSSDDVRYFKNMDKLKTLLFYPDTGYTLTANSQQLIKSLQFIRPDLQVNEPDKVYSEDSLVSIQDIKTPDVTDETSDTILAGLLKPDVESIYKKCIKFSSKSGSPVLKGNCLIYKADPLQSDWGSKRKFTSSGNVIITEAKKKGLNVPTKLDDYDTFVYIYPTYTRTGSYTSGTKAYSQTLNVQVFNISDKKAYSSESVGTAAAPQSFTYYVGSMPDKHSGTVDTNKAYSYLKKLKKE